MHFYFQFSIGMTLHEKMKLNWKRKREKTLEMAFDASARGMLFFFLLAVMCRFQWYVRCKRPNRFSKCNKLIEIGACIRRIKRTNKFQAFKSKMKFNEWIHPKLCANRDFRTNHHWLLNCRFCTVCQLSFGISVVSQGQIVHTKVRDFNLHSFLAF